MAYPIIRTQFPAISSVPPYERRELLWDDCILRSISNSAKLTYVEFGVYEGYSINYFAQRNTHPESRFIGLDSFEGLPDDWEIMPKGTFSTNGTIPPVTDERNSFIKGWFQNTWDALHARLAADTGNLVVHYDADLYSPTLFALSKIYIRKRPYRAIFDEFTGYESRALYNYMQSYDASVTVLGKTLFAGYRSKSRATSARAVASGL